MTSPSKSSFNNNYFYSSCHSSTPILNNRESTTSPSSNKLKHPQKYKSHVRSQCSPYSRHHRTTTTTMTITAASALVVDSSTSETSDESSLINNQHQHPTTPVSSSFNESETTSPSQSSSSLVITGLLRRHDIQSSEKLHHVTPATSSDTSSPQSSLNAAAVSSGCQSSCSVEALSRSTSLASLASEDVQSIRSTFSSVASTASTNGLITPAYSELPDSPGSPCYTQPLPLNSHYANSGLFNQYYQYNVPLQFNNNSTNVTVLTVDSCASKSNEVTVMERTMLPNCYPVTTIDGCGGGGDRKRGHVTKSDLSQHHISMGSGSSAYNSGFSTLTKNTPTINNTLNPFQENSGKITWPLTSVNFTPPVKLPSSGSINHEENSVVNRVLSFAESTPARTTELNESEILVHYYGGEDSIRDDAESILSVPSLVRIESEALQNKPIFFERLFGSANKLLETTNTESSSLSSPCFATNNQMVSLNTSENQSSNEEEGEYTEEEQFLAKFIADTYNRKTTAEIIDNSIEENKENEDSFDSSIDSLESQLNDNKVLIDKLPYVNPLKQDAELIAARILPKIDEESEEEKMNQSVFSVKKPEFSKRLSTSSLNSGRSTCSAPLAKVVLTKTARLRMAQKFKEMNKEDKNELKKSVLNKAQKPKLNNNNNPNRTPAILEKKSKSSSTSTAKSPVLVFSVNNITNQFKN